MITIQAECPHCHRSLMDEQHLIQDKSSISLMGRLPGGVTGAIRLCAFYGDYTIVVTLLWRHISYHRAARFRFVLNEDAKGTC